ncbi:Bromodomain adjacent to zinc finger domain protein 2B [Camelus dromedarius]|uniref:Bromodomain adjacent to zinc finger domain protein 2B n=1 Tax=Camelus dromedarius TaxID=9838 RepID=A0A5N4E5R1_CAMDR|nr:Bromodomain adjacent to zinc finger domain protein 2B [Camelus dromedarius]
MILLHSIQGLQEKVTEMVLKKKPRKKTMESSSNSDSDSGTSSDTSSEGISSSDSDDLEEDEEEDQSIEESEDDDSDSESEAQHKSNNQKQPQVLSQQLPFIFQSSQAKEESVNKHTSVIQSTGLVSNVKPLSLVNQAKKETYMKLIVPSPDALKAGNKNTSEESSPLTSELRSKREQYKQTFPAQLKKQESSKSLKKVIAALSNPKATSSSPAHPKQTLENNHPNPFLTNALLVEQFRGTDSDIPSSKDSEDSNEDEEEDDEEEDEEEDEDDESDDSQSESDSNSESDTEGSEEDDDDDKDQDESDSTSKRRRVTDERELRIPLEYGYAE